MRWQCRIAPSLGGGFAGTPEEVWGTTDYKNNTDPTVFFGCYGLKDVAFINAHQGRKAILWAGSDIRHFMNGYWLDDEGIERVEPEAILEAFEGVEHYCENWVEQAALEQNGIEAKVAPSFLGDIDDYDVSFEANNKYYTSVSGDDWELYGWHRIPEIAETYPTFEFHLYGNEEIPPFEFPENVIVHGRVSQEKMDEEIKGMQGAIRLTEFDGFSEILAKSVLWGQWPVSPFINYPHMDENPTPHTSPNTEGRDYYKSILNRYPWNVQIDETSN